MAKVSLLNLQGEKVKDVTLNDKVWKIEGNDAVLHNAVILAQASLRQGTHKTKNRSEVSGGGRKPWKQKGTGRARQGSIRSPQWTGGGIVFGPTPRDYSKKMNRKERRLALKTALTYILQNKNLVAVDNFVLATPKTKDMLKTISNLKVTGKVLVVVNELEEFTYLASRNLPEMRMIEANSLNVLDLLNCDYMVITEEAIKQVEEALTNE